MYRTLFGIKSLLENNVARFCRAFLRCAQSNCCLVHRGRSLQLPAKHFVFTMCGGDLHSCYTVSVSQLQASLTGQWCESSVLNDELWRTGEQAVPVCVKLALVMTLLVFVLTVLVSTPDGNSDCPDWVVARFFQPRRINSGILPRNRSGRFVQNYFQICNHPSIINIYNKATGAWSWSLLYN